MRFLVKFNVARTLANNLPSKNLVGLDKIFKGAADMQEGSLVSQRVGS